LPVAEANDLEIRFAKTERINFVGDGKRFKCRFITPGIISYKDVNGGVDLVRKEVIDECLNSMVGAVLTIKHPPKELIIERNFTDVAHGKVDKVGYDEATGFYFAEGTVETDAARERINAGDGVSCGFSVLEAGDGGTWMQVPYTQEDRKIEFHHIALVENPRIEDADIRFNAKGTSMNPIVTFIRKIAGADKQTTEQKKELPLSTKINLGDGKSATFEEMLAVERANAVHEIGPDDWIEHEGMRYNAMDLVNHYREHCAMGRVRMNDTETPEQKAAREQAAKDKEIALAKQRENATLSPEQKAAKEKADAEAAIQERIKQARAEERAAIERENEQARGRASFQQLRDAPLNQSQEMPKYELSDSGSLDDGVALGRERYGKKPNTAGRN
jgi:hypothetical protein